MKILCMYLLLPAITSAMMRKSKMCDSDTEVTNLDPLKVKFWLA